MLNDEEKDALAGRFRASLDMAPDADLTEDQAREGDDLFSLWSALTGLKNEVRIEARQFMSALEDFREVFGALDESSRQTAASVAALTADRRDTSRRLVMPLLLGLLDIHDRLRDSARQLATPPPRGPRVPWFFRPRDDERARQAHHQGQLMVLERLEQLLAQQGVLAFSAEGLAFDPQRMKAEGCVSRPDLPEGLVTEECRRGFLWHGELLRPAEVVVNRANTA